MVYLTVIKVWLNVNTLQNGLVNRKCKYEEGRFLADSGVRNSICKIRQNLKPLLIRILSFTVDVLKFLLGVLIHTVPYREFLKTIYSTSVSIETSALQTSGNSAVFLMVKFIASVFQFDFHKGLSIID